jgi:hypothetical protein
VPLPVFSVRRAAWSRAASVAVATPSIVLLLVLASCGGEASHDAEPDLTIRDDRPGAAIDRRVLGTNVPAWLGPEVLADPRFVEAAIQSGATLLRMPGGSWSNSYDWLACESSEPDECPWTWAARPSDFIDFMQATKLPGMWTISLNETAESAAAAVAFFNGSVSDERSIGIDRSGVDWGTVGNWARLRSEHGNHDPVPIELWEVGNEVYGARADVGGGECAAFGWEYVWTCDGEEYAVGDESHDGYLAIRKAMLAVDPDIVVGAVGVSDPDAWSGWGRKVIEAAGESLDLYSVHEYGFDSSPDSGDALTRSAEMWPDVISNARESLPDDVAIAVTEYNLVSTEAGDTSRSMTRAVNALFIADSIGQLVVGGVDIANQWNLANGTTDSGTDYGMIALQDFTTFPQYDAMRLWSAIGDSLLETEGTLPDSVHVYSSRHADGRASVIFINLDDSAQSFDLAFRRNQHPTGSIQSLRADGLDATTLIAGATTPVSARSLGQMRVRLPAYSISLMEVESRA